MSIRDSPSPTTINQPIDSSRTSPSTNSPSITPAASADGVVRNILDPTANAKSTTNQLIFNRISDEL